MGEQYLRSCRVTLEGASSAVIDESFRIRFELHQFVTGTPENISLFIYNLSRTTAQHFLQREYAKISLEAGYLSGSGLIFKGEILQARLLRENITDTGVHVIATSQGVARNYAVVNRSLAAGHTFRDRVDVATKAMQAFGVTVGHIDDLGSKKFARGFVCHGMAKDMLRELCFATNASWNITNGRFNLLKNTNTLPGDVIVLNSDTGMVGLPEQTLQGVIVRCLLNPRIIPGSKLQINESSIQRAAFDPSIGGSANNELLGDNNILGVAADGLYKALKVEHDGDTRAPNWYTTIVCVKLNGGAVLNAQSYAGLGQAGVQ